MTILEISDLRVCYGSIEAIHGVNLKLEEGKITAIIGSNGAGKTTIINAISGTVHRTGTLFYKGSPLTEKTNRVVQQGIVQVPEGRKIFAGLTVEENLRLGAYALKNQNEVGDLIHNQYCMFPILKDRKNQDAGTL
ncbi:MAG: ATP-binding cassette domain-containing protein, partial [Anaerolineales bacterium]|nr:ATP-binding cassette domain-containing protein [Anaerolineales bacterium]